MTSKWLCGLKGHEWRKVGTGGVFITADGGFAPMGSKWVCSKCGAEG